MKKEERTTYFDLAAEDRDAWKKRNWYYHWNVEKLLQFLVPSGETILEIGSGTGDLLVALKPKHAVGLDVSERMTASARAKYPHIEWVVGDAEDLKIGEQFNWVVMSDLLGFLDDIEQTFSNLNRVTHPHSKIVVPYYNYLWEPILRFAELLHLKKKQPLQNWLSSKDIENMLSLGGFEVIKSGVRLLFPFYIPFISSLLNRFFGNLPLINKLGVLQYTIARPISREKRDYSVSVIIPCRNEKGNIERAMERMPQFGTYLEIIFVEKGSNDGTMDEIKRVANLYAGKRNIRILEGEIDTKRDKVRQGFEAAKGEMLMILDADLTVRPEDLPKFYRAMASGRGEFINGSRLVYQLEKESMRFFNVLGNKFFSIAFTWLLGQRLKDTLCGTKVLLKNDYEAIVKGRDYFGDFDPFGDFDLLFGAAKLNLKIVEMPIRYQARIYGTTNIKRWRHGVILLRMVWFAMWRIKFI